MLPQLRPGRKAAHRWRAPPWHPHPPRRQQLDRDLPADQLARRVERLVAERAFADLKAHRGLQRFRSYGRPRALTQVGLVVLAPNGLQLLRARSQRTPEAPKPLTPTGEKSDDL